MADHYEAIIQKKFERHEICSPREQAGQWWDEERQVDIRLEKADPKEKGPIE